MRKLYFIYFLLLSPLAFTQKTYTIKGRITDAVTHDPIPFSSVNIKNSSLGKNTDFEGNFIFQLSSIPSDSLIISCLGYFNKSIFISKDSLVQTFNIQLKPSEILLQEVKVYAKGENPAYKIIRNAVAAKSENNYKNWMVMSIKATIK